jgi:hypothetical protein
MAPLLTAAPCAAINTTAAIPLLVVLAVVQIALMVLAVVDIDRRAAVTWDRKWLWILIVVLFGMIGPVAYFAVGRKEAAVDEAAGRRSTPAADGSPAAEQPATAGDRAATAADVLYGARQESADIAPGENAASPPEETSAP